MCENTLAHAHRLTSDPWQSCAQKAQHHVHKGESVLYAIAARADLDFITFCSKKRARQNLYNEIRWMRKNLRTSLEGHKPKVQLGVGSDLLLQAAAHIISVARR